MLLYKYGVKYILTFWYKNKWMQKVLGTPTPLYAYQRWSISATFLLTLILTVIFTWIIVFLQSFFIYGTIIFLDANQNYQFPMLLFIFCLNLLQFRNELNERNWDCRSARLLRFKITFFEVNLIITPVLIASFLWS
jgi:predicted CDP-diglyceride synthetase/phosphatidate cytidylyltransferase